MSSRRQDMPPFGDCDNADAAPDHAGERPTARLNECCMTAFGQIAKDLLRTTFAQEHFQEKWDRFSVRKCDKRKSLSTFSFH
jgi:hypothetical protein